MGMTFIHPVQGLHAAPGVAGPKFCSEAVNVYDYQERIVKRGGMRPINSVTGLADSNVFVGLGVGTTEPVSAGNTDVTFNGTTHTALYAGHASPFNRLNIPADLITYINAAITLGKLTIEFWNGSVWTALACDHLWKPTWNTTYNAAIIAPLVARVASGAGNVINDNSAVSMVFTPPTTWALKTINGKSKYWIRIRGYTAAQMANTVVYGSLGEVCTTDNRIIAGLTFVGRNNARHEFLVSLFGTTGKVIEFTINGEEAALSESLQPDGTSVMFGPNTKARAVYHEPTDRVIGHVQGLGWFYSIPTAAAEVYSFTPYDGTGTRYASEPDGLRSAFPDADVFCIHEGRIFSAKGSRVYWTAPDEFVAIQPNANFADISDECGDIIAMESVAGVLVIFKRDSTWTMQPDGSAEGYQKQRIQGGMGCIAPASIAKFGGDLYRLTEAGPAVLRNATREQPIQESIQDFFSRTWSSDPTKAVGVFSSFAGDQYRLFYPSAGSAGILDKALYGSVVGKELRWWPQGKYATADSGFNATCVFVDTTRQQNRMLIGDRYGVLWEADAGFYDRGTIVKSYFRSAPVGSVGGQMRVVRWVNTSFKNTGAFNWTLGLRTETKSEYAKAAVLSASRATPALSNGIAVAAATVTNASTAVDVVDVQMRQAQFGMRCRQFELSALSAVACAMEWNGFEVEVNATGRRTEG